MEELKYKIGQTWNDITEMCQDFMCLLPGVVYFGEIQSIPYSSAKIMEMYDENTTTILEFTESQESVKLIAIY